MFFRKKVDAVEMGSELAKLFGSNVPLAMFRFDNVASGFNLKIESYNPTTSKISYPLFALTWVFALCQTMFISVKDGNVQKLQNGMWKVLDALSEKYGIRVEQRSEILALITQAVAKDVHFTSTGFLQDYDRNKNLGVHDRKGLSYNIARIICDLCLGNLQLSGEQMATAVSMLVTDFEYNFRLGAHSYKQVRVI
jgi:hypothetical protein